MKYIFAITIAFLLLAHAPMPANAEVCGSSDKSAIQLSVYIPGLTIKGTSEECYYFTGGLPKYIAGIYNFALRIGGFLAAIMIMIGGARWVAAGGNSEKITKAKEQIINAIVGLLLLLFSYTILNTINPALVNLQPIALSNVKNPLAESRFKMMKRQGLDDEAAAFSAISLAKGSASEALIQAENLYNNNTTSRKEFEDATIQDAISSLHEESLREADAALAAYRQYQSTLTNGESPTPDQQASLDDIYQRDVAPVLQIPNQIAVLKQCAGNPEDEGCP